MRPPWGRVSVHRHICANSFTVANGIMGGAQYMAVGVEKYHPPTRRAQQSGTRVLGRWCAGGGVSFGWCSMSDIFRHLKVEVF